MTEIEVYNKIDTGALYPNVLMLPHFYPLFKHQILC